MRSTAGRCWRGWESVTNLGGSILRHAHLGVASDNRRSYQPLSGSQALGPPARCIPRGRRLSSSPHVCATSDGFRTRFEMLPSAQDDGDHNVVCVFEACPDPRFALVWLKKTQKDSWHWRSPRGDRGCRLLLKESGPSLVNKDVKSLRWLSFGTCSSDTSCRQKSHAYVGQPHAVRRPTARVPPNGICAPPVETLFHNHNVRRVSTPYFSQKHAHCHLGLHISLTSVGRVDDSE